MVMKGIKKIIASGIVLVGLAGLIGCDKRSPQAYVVTEPKNFGSYFDSRSSVGIAIGDVDGDGLNDLIVGNPFQVKYFRNIGNGKFEEKQIVCEPRNFGSYFDSRSGVGMALGDIDGDGLNDLIVGNPFQVRTYHNDNGKFVENTQ